VSGPVFRAGHCGRSQRCQHFYRRVQFQPPALLALDSSCDPEARNKVYKHAQQGCRRRPADGRIIPVRSRGSPNPRQRPPEAPKAYPLVLALSRPPLPPARPVVVVETSSPPSPARRPAIVTIKLVPETAARAAVAFDHLEFAAFSSPLRREITPVWMPDPTPGDIKVAWMPQLMMTG